MPDLNFVDGCAHSFHTSPFSHPPVQARSQHSKVGVLIKRDTVNCEFTNHMLLITHTFTKRLKVYMCRLSSGGGFVLENNQSDGSDVRCLRVGFESGGTSSVVSLQGLSKDVSCAGSLSSNGSMAFSLFDRSRDLKIGSNGVGLMCVRDPLTNPLYVGVSIPWWWVNNKTDAMSLSFALRYIRNGWDVSAFTKNWLPAGFTVSTSRGVTADVTGKGVWGFDKAGAFMRMSVLWKWLELSVEFPSGKFSCVASV